MNLRKLAFFIMTISFILIISGGVSSFVQGLRKDREDTYKRQIDVNNTFEEFSTNTTIFENMRDELYNEVLSNTFLDTMYEQDKGVKEKLSNYEQLVDELSNNVQELDVLCNNMYFPDSVTNSRCKNYQLIYEQVINYFVSDVNTYNKNIQKYNEYQAGLGTLLRILEYETDKNYIDYNADNHFDGKEE